MSGQNIKVMVVDDHPLIIDGLKSILQDEEDVTFAGGFNNMREAMEFLSQNKVDVALVDISMPEHSGIEITLKIKKLYPQVQVLALTMHEDITMITKMIDAGASGYLLKRTNMNEVLEAIRVVAANDKYLGREVQAIMMGNLIHKETKDILQPNAPAALTPREKEILTLVSQEFRNEKIAEKLFISERTVETHRRNIFTKTNTKTIIGLIKYAIKHRLINQDNEEEKQVT